MQPFLLTAVAVLLRTAAMTTTTAFQSPSLLLSNFQTTSCIVATKRLTFSPTTIHSYCFSDRKFLRLTADDDNSSNNSNKEGIKKKRKRKDGKTLSDNKAQQTPELTNKLSSDAVTMQVMDVRDIVSGTTIPSLKEGDDDTDEYEYYYEEEEVKDEENKNVSGKKGGDSLERLLADAKEMRLSSSSPSSNEKKQQTSAISSVLSTVVTADFFVVCALLIWFLVGIFCSYALKNDTVQIAFNGIFQPVVQPALGVLMIGSAASALFRQTEEENDESA